MKPGELVLMSNMTEELWSKYHWCKGSVAGDTRRYASRGEERSLPTQGIAVFNFRKLKALGYFSANFKD